MEPLLPARSASSSCGTTARQFTLRDGFIAIGLIAVWLAWFPFASWGSRAVLACIGLTFYFGCWKTRRAVLFITPAMYVPYSWLFMETSDLNWGSYRWHWIGMLWQLPGLTVEALFHPLPDLTFHLITAGFTVVVFMTAVIIGRPSYAWAIAVSTVVLLASCFNSVICYALYRA